MRDGVGSGLGRDKRETNGSESTTQEPTFIQARIKRIRDVVETLTARARTANDNRRQLLFKRIDTLRALVDRLMRRPVTKVVDKRDVDSETHDDWTKRSTLRQIIDSLKARLGRLPVDGDQYRRVKNAIANLRRALRTLMGHGRVVKRETEVDEPKTTKSRQLVAIKKVDSLLSDHLSRMSPNRAIYPKLSDTIEAIREIHRKMSQPDASR